MSLLCVSYFAGAESGNKGTTPALYLSSQEHPCSLPGKHIIPATSTLTARQLALPPLGRAGLAPAVRLSWGTLCHFHNRNVGGTLVPPTLSHIGLGPKALANTCCPHTEPNMFKTTIPLIPHGENDTLWYLELWETSGYYMGSALQIQKDYTKAYYSAFMQQQNQGHRFQLHYTWLDNTSCEKDLVVAVDHKQNISLHCTWLQKLMW